VFEGDVETLPSPICITSGETTPLISLSYHLAFSRQAQISFDEKNGSKYSDYSAADLLAQADILLKSVDRFKLKAA
jgi:hypothetical protein